MASLAVELAEIARPRLGPLETAHLATSIAAKLRVEPCDLTFKRAREWARRRRLGVDAVAAWALDQGAVCDCEILDAIASRASS
jgi:hypothetical protein